MLADRLGQPLMPWQQLVADVGLEIAADGLPAYREVWVTIPRQNGKTTLVLVWEVDRAIGWGTPQRIAYTAQTGWDARKKLLDDQVPALMATPLRSTISRVLRGVGNEGVLFKGGSRIDVLASSASAGHGRTLDLGVIDEAFDDTDDRREQAILPAMSTRAAAQLLGVSTMGTDAAVFLNRKIDAGRDAILRDLDRGIAYFEWSADPDDDPDDPATWWACMPALGYTITEDVVRHARQTMDDGEFRRAYLNLRTASDERIISAAAWAAVVSNDVAPDTPATVAVDCNPERTWGSIIVADAAGHIEVVEHDRGVGWIPPRAAAVARQWGNAKVALDPGGPAGRFVKALTGEGVEVLEVGGHEFVNACAAFYDAVADQKIAVRAHETLDVAVAAARKKPAGEAWVWTRKGETDISPLVASTVGYWAALHASEPLYAY